MINESLSILLRGLTILVEKGWYEMLVWLYVVLLKELVDSGVVGPSSVLQASYFNRHPQRPETTEARGGIPVITF